jgi:hypothetical protein
MKLNWKSAGIGFLVACLLWSVAVFVGYEVNWIRKRQVARSNMTYLAKPTRAPGLLWIFGEPAHKAIDLKQEVANESEFKRVFELFPEVETINAHHDKPTG